MSNTENKSYELLKPGLSYISERTSAFGYSDGEGKMQYLQPVSRYKAFNEIKRGEAVSVITKDELEKRAIEVNTKSSKTEPILFTSGTTDTQIENVKIGDETVVSSKTEKYTITVGDETFVKILQTTYDYSTDGGEITQNVKSETVTFCKSDNLEDKIEFPRIIDDGNPKSFSKVKESITSISDWPENWGDTDNVNVIYTYDLNESGDAVIMLTKVINQTNVNEIMNDPDPYVTQTNTKIHERTIGLAMEYAEKYGSVVHVQPYGKFIYDTEYEGEDEDFYGKDNVHHDVFNHTNKEYNPKFTYKDVGKKVYIAFPQNGVCGHLTLNEEDTSKHYHNIICLGYLTDAPNEEIGSGKTEIEISISGDQRGLLEATQFECALGESVVMSSKDPIRVFAIGKETDTKFKARLCLTPQNTVEFSDTDFIAFQKMDGNTAIIHFTENFNIDGIIDDDDVSFIHMAKCYASIKKETIGTYAITDINDLQTTEGVSANIHKLENALSSAFTQVSGKELNIKSYSDAKNPFGYIDMESTDFGGYYAMYVSSGVASKFDGSVTLCHGSNENRGKAVLADTRISTRRDLLGIYYGARWDEELEAGYVTVFMKIGEFDIPEKSLQFDGNFQAGQEYYLGMNGRIVKYPYNQYDFISKIGSVKYGDGDDLRFVVDIGDSSNRYNGDLPVGYMKPAVRIGTEYAAEYGFLLMDGEKTYPKEKPYMELYSRLLGWFDKADIDISGSDTFKIPEVSRMIPDEVLGEDGTVETKQVKVPMQIKYLASGIYEEMPRIPFKRFFGKFQFDNSSDVEDRTPVKCFIEECDITDIVDYGINEDGYTKPGLDNLDIHLFVDPNEDYKNGMHDWHEVHEGFINWNNSTTFGYTWKIIEEEASDEHPYGCYKLSMDIGESQGVAYVTSMNQAPKKLNGCHYKLYVARREVFARQFDIEKIYKNYLTNSVYTDDAKSKVVLDKAVTGKAVIDAIENRSTVKKLIGAKDGEIILGSKENPLKELGAHTTSNFVIVAKEGIVLQNTDEENSQKVIMSDGEFRKIGNNINPYDINDDGTYNVDDDVIPTIGQVRKHSESVIENGKSISDYKNADNQSGKIHGMVFGKDGNINASTLWGIEPKVSSNENLEKNITDNNVYIPVVRKTANDFETHVEGTTKFVSSDESKFELYSEKRYAGTIPTIVDDNNANPGTVDAIIDRINSTKGVFVKAYALNGVTKAIERIDLEKNDISFLSIDKNNGTSTGLTLHAAGVISSSRSEYKRVHGELIRDPDLVDSKDLVDNSKQYDDDEGTNKLKTILGSALQAAYEMPLAYWQYNTEKEWYKDRLGVIVQRVESVAKNITGKSYATATVGSKLTIKSKEFGGNGISVTFTYNDNGTVTVETKKGDKQFSCEATKIGDLDYNELVSFHGEKDVELVDLIKSETGDDTLTETTCTVTLEGGSEKGTERELFERFYDEKGDNEVVTTPEVNATITIDNLKVTAKKAGKEGNDICISCEMTTDDEHYRLSVFKNDTLVETFLGKDIDELHTEDSTEDNPERASSEFVTFEKVGENSELSNFPKTYLAGGTSGTSVSKNIVNTDYQENEYQYTEDESKSIKEYLTAIIDNSSSGQDVISTVGMLLKAAKETQERLLRVEASTFGRDYETIPGKRDPYKLTGMPGVVPDPTNYGLNRLIRAICQELYYDSNPFDTALANGKTDINVSSFSRIDRLDREIHGELNSVDEDSVKTAPNTLNEIDSSTYPYEDMIRAKDVKEIREAEFTMETYDALATERGNNVKTRVDMSLYNKDSNGDYNSELAGNEAEKSGQFNGVVDAIYRITTKLNALTESINNSDNIADSPKRLNTIRQNIEHIIREAYFDDAYVIDVSGEVDNTTPGEDKDVKVFATHERVDAEPYHDVNGPSNAPYIKNVSRFDKLTDDLYKYSITVSGEGIASFQNFYELGDEKVAGKPYRDPETGEIIIPDSDTQVYYTGRKFNGKHLLVDNRPESDGTEVEYTTEIHSPQNLNDYNYATLLDIVVDAIGDEFFRKNVSKKSDKDDSWNNREELRHNKTISERLDEIEKCLDKVVGKLSRKHSFEEETSVFDGKVGTNADTPREEGNKGVNASETVFSIDRYLQFMNDYLGYHQTTDNDINFGQSGYDKNNINNKKTETYTEHWENGVDYKIEHKKEDGSTDAENAGIDGKPTNGKEYSAEWALAHKRNIHAGLVNMLSRIQNEETRSSRYDAILGDDFKSTAEGLSTTYTDFGKDHNGESDYQERISTVNYNLTDDIMDILKTIYGRDNHNTDQTHENGSFTDFTHRTIIKAENEDVTANKNVRFVADYDNGKNIIDVMVHDMYLLPQPLRLAENISEVTPDVNGLIDGYMTATNLYIPTSPSAMNENDKSVIKDSRIAAFYDFDCNVNAYDIPDNENALSWNNREEFFNETGRFIDSEIDNIPSQLHTPHARLSRFEVIENEIRSLRHLIGLDFKNWNGNDDLVNLKFKGELTFFGDRLDNKFGGNPFGTEDKSYTDQFNQGDDTNNTALPTNILKFMLNTDKSERLLRTELGFSRKSDWTHETIDNDLTGYDTWYDGTYDSDKNENEKFISLRLSEVNSGSNTLANYGLYGQNDTTYGTRRSIYDRMLALEKNAVKVDAWMDSIKNLYHNNCGKNIGKGNIFDIVNYLGNYKWDDDDSKYYGAFGELDTKDLRLTEDEITATSKYDNVTDEINNHHKALKDLFNIIGTDENTEIIEQFGIENPDTNIRNNVTKKDTIWARLNAVEKINLHDIDITNVVTTSFNEDDDGQTNGVVNITDGKGNFITSEELENHLRTLSDNNSEDALVKSTNDHQIGKKELIASKGYVDNAIIAGINKYASEVDKGDEKAGVLFINGTDISKQGTSSTTTVNGETIQNTPIIINYKDEKSEESNVIKIGDFTKIDDDSVVENLDVQDYLNAETINKLVDAINKVNENSHKNLHSVYGNLNNLMVALNYEYNKSVEPTTTGSLISFN